MRMTTKTEGSFDERLALLDSATKLVADCEDAPTSAVERAKLITQVAQELAGFATQPPNAETE